MAEAVLKGTTSYLHEIFIADSSSIVGGGLTGLVYNSSGLTAYYYRSGAGASVAITLVNMTVGTWASGGFKEIDATNMPGWYQVGIPDAALASGARSVSIHFKDAGALNMVPVPLAIPLSGIDNQNANSFGLAYLSGDAYARLGAAGAGLTALGDTRLAFLTGDAYARLGAPAGASVSADVAVITAFFPQGIKKNTAFAYLPFTMRNSTTKALEASPTSLAVQRKIDDGSFATGGLTNIVNVGGGLFTIDGIGGDVNGTFITLRATAANCDTTFITFHTVL